jgi:catechol 2,3-dioxygenase-like lactoylglutathione lyase family enzyme
MAGAMQKSAQIVAFVGTTDPDRARTFYRDTLGLRLVHEDGFALQFDVNGIMLRVTNVRQLQPAPFTVLGWAVSDISGAVKELEQAGVRFERYNLPQDDLGVWTAPGGAKVAWFKDPDGNTLSLQQNP